MPNSTPPPQVQDVDLEQESLVTALEQMRDAYALSLVNKTFSLYESYRQNNQDVHWNNNDALFSGAVVQKNWTGTNTPRSSYAMPITFDQIESAIPAIMQALFGMPEWFQVEADAGGNIQAARAVGARLKHVLDHNKDEFGFSFENDIELAVKQLLMYGNGGVSIEWNAEKKAPVISWVDLRDIYFDPGASIPSVDFNRSIIRHTMKTVDEIITWRDTPGMNIPENDQLWHMAKSRPSALSDTTKQVQNALLGYINTDPSMTATVPLPADNQIEVLTYYSKSRIIIVLNRQWVAFNAPNDYGFIPLAFAPCYIVPGQSYGLSVADVLEKTQRYMEALMNLHLDELHLALEPPRAQKAGSTLTPNQQRWAPGRVFKFSDPKADMIPFMPNGVTANIFEELNYLMASGERRTGINSLGQGGIPLPSNANRTMGGMQMQLSGSALRLYPLVKHIEDYLLVPMLYKCHRMTQIHTGLEDQLPATGEQGQPVNVSGAAFRLPVTFKILAASKMLSRDKLAQVIPFIIQYMMAGPFIQGLAQSGMTINWQELFQMFQDATGIGRLYELVRPLTDQEKQQQNQPPPQVIMEQQKAQQQNQLRLQLAQMSNQTELQKVQMQKQQSPMEIEAERTKLEMDQMREMMKIEVENQKAQIAREQAEMQLQVKRLEMQLKQQELQMKAYMGQQEHAQNMQIRSQQAALDQELTAAQHQQAVVQTQQMQQVKALAPKPAAGNQEKTKARQPRKKE